ncbi:MAG: Divergent domain protein [Chryseobacterium sp.]|jgi:hypothetical protein|uniref:AlbA family DNA-binding domain-containing protein n=1 Tax=Chryseobacterium sp. TaxID=1871047 RepID=UPI00261EB352|nr:ATP-binding protein [Chryseobacterium sp.]MDF2552442.1 Divergent domain protein [Chryseobacterium sp.]
MSENWSLELINEHIKNKIEENLHLDYKAAGSLEKNEKKANELSKDISAFANSDGGTIIYGIKEDIINKHIPDKIDSINRNVISKEWIEQIIQGRITPRIQGILITPITISEPNDVIYVVEIPKSDTAHQANDRKYYKRFNFNSEPMYDYEIKDILNRNKYPKIDLEFEILKIENENREYYYLYVNACNNGKVYANYINAYFTFNKMFLKENEDSLIDEKFEYSCDNTIRDLVDITFTGLNREKKYGPSRYDPILPRLKFEIKKIKLNRNFLETDFEIKWVVFADNAEPNAGKINLKEIKIKTIK